jgi:hypothetical protein
MPLTIAAIALDRTRQLVLVDDLPPVSGSTAFALFTMLADQHATDLANGLHVANYTYIKPGDLARSLGVGCFSVRREVSRIRKRMTIAFLQAFSIPLSRTALIDGAYRKGYRLNPKVQVLDPLQLPR